jgi:gamma-glutamyl-gamma-aminobutyraldehyde dehydrogenase
LKRVSLECGGKTPQIFLADLPDLDTAVTYAINGIFGNMGEVCNAGSRLLLDRPIAKEFLARFIERGKDAYRAGDPLDPTTNLGPLVTAAHRSRVMSYINRGKSEGARLEFGGGSPDLPGAFVNPTGSGSRSTRRGQPNCAGALGRANSGMRSRSRLWNSSIQRSSCDRGPGL